MKKKKEKEMMIFMKEAIKIVISFLTHRLFVLSILLIFLFSILVARLFELQIINGKKLEEEFELRVIREVAIEGQRGAIYDRKGTPLAINEASFKVMYDNSVYSPDRNKLLIDLIRILKKNGDTLSIEFPIVLNEDQNYTFVDSPSRESRFKKDIFSDKIKVEQSLYTAPEMMDYLIDTFFEIDREEITELELTNSEILDLVTIRYALWAKGFYKFIPQEISKGISEESLAQIKESEDSLPGVLIEEEPVRKYLYPEYTAHIIGYTGTMSDEALLKYEPYGYDQNDIVGRIGIESAMELYLHASDGHQVVEVNNFGRTMNVIEEVAPTAGKDVYLTIDLDLQKKTQDILVKQLCNIVSQKLVLKKPTVGELRLPLLKDVYISLFKNNTIRLEPIFSSEEATFSRNILDEYTTFYNNRIESLIEELETSNVGLNAKLADYNNYILSTLVNDGLLSREYINSSGYIDYTEDNISFRGLLNYLIKDQYLTVDSTMDSDHNSKKWSDDEKYNYLNSEILQKDYFGRYQFITAIFLEMIDLEVFSYLDLSMLLIEQKIITVDDDTLSKLQSRKLSPLDFMKQIILNVQLTPQQLNLDPSTGGAVIVDVHTGQVLALVSYPSYDNNRISDYAYYQELLADPSTPLYPTATQGKTAPGSTFKMVSAVAGLEEGVITKNSIITCTGHFTKVNPNVACWIAANGSSHGPINVVTALAVSCNSFFNEVGYRLGLEGNKYVPQKGVETLDKYVKMFGLDTTTGIELIESKPSIPGNAPTEDGTVNPVTAAMGQEFNSYTPTQMARYIATLANGGTLYNLTLIDRVYNSDGTLYMKKEPVVVQQTTFKEGTIETVLEGMFEVTAGARGTGRVFYSDFPITVAGKTGTAQENKNRASHAVFASFAPFENPEIAIVVEIPYSYTKPFSSGYIVGTVARDLYAAYYDLFKAPQSENYEQELYNEDQFVDPLNLDNASESTSTSNQ